MEGVRTTAYDVASVHTYDLETRLHTSFSSNSTSKGSINMSTSIRPDTIIDAAKSMLKLPEARTNVFDRRWKSESGHGVV